MNTSKKRYCATVTDRRQSLFYLDDCLNVLPALSDESVDCIITDPPYHITDPASITFVGSKPTSVKKRWGHWEKDTFEEYEAMVCSVIDQAKRILKENKVLIMWLRAEYGGYFARYAETIGFKLFTTLCWEKPNPVPHIRHTNYRSSFEYAMVVCNGKKSIPFNWLGQKRMKNVFKHPIGNKVTAHPTEKPESLFSWHVEVHTDPGDVVLDPFMGSGTTGVVCAKTGRNFTGIEMNEAYYRMAHDRIRTAEMQMRMPI
jgi:DNA modification methylase